MAHRAPGAPTMFYLLELNRELEVQPRHFGPKLAQEVEKRLRQEVSGLGGMQGLTIMLGLPSLATQCPMRRITTG